MLNLCAFLSSENIDIDLFVNNNIDLPEPLNNQIINTLTKDKIISELTKFSLLVKNTHNNLSMHRLLQEVVRKQQGEDIQWLIYCLRMISSSINYVHGSIDSLNSFKCGITHAISVTEYFSNLYLNDNVITLFSEEVFQFFASLYFTMGLGLEAMGLYRQSLKHHKKSLHILKNIIDDKGVQTKVSPRDWTVKGFVY